MVSVLSTSQSMSLLHGQRALPRDATSALHRGPLYVKHKYCEEISDFNILTVGLLTP